MRIRKNKKLSSLIYPHVSRPESVHVCRLNQSPWDVIPLPQGPYLSSLHHQYEGEYSFNGNGSMGDTIGAVESSVASMMGSEGKAIMKAQGMVIQDNDDDNQMKIAKRIGFKIQCEEEDDKEPNQEALLKSCSNATNNDNSDSGNNPSLLTTKKTEENNQLTGSRRGRTRAARKGSSSASNLSEFYYYSGFGPSRGKRRRGSNTVGKISNNIIEAKEVENNGSAIITQNNTILSSFSQINNTEEELDYVDQEEDDENEYSRQKRTRKPIKARSLKSLM